MDTFIINPYRFAAPPGPTGPVAGYAAGGYDGSFLATTDKMPFATETTSANATNITSAKIGGAGGDSESTGYHFGGTTGTVTSVTEKMPFATDTFATSAPSALTQARTNLACFDSDTTAYPSGGYTTAAVNTGDKMPFATETTSANASNLVAARSGPRGLASSSNGYVYGGSAATVLATAEKMPFSTETFAANAASDLLAARWLMATFANDTTGYICGGFSTSNATSPVTTVYKMPFSTETTAANASSLGAARGAPFGFASDLNGYVLGGYNTTHVVTAYKMPFSTETFATNSSSNLTAARRQGASFRG